ncbi:MAG: helix-turn-helix transcriptional regulator [Clostridiales bacterium]|jgi:transcriptional regulator with XRE-family HTH domain|nr:helix-turn-helix transcriptional regulator [Clostridiales bacterium]
MEFKERIKELRTEKSLTQTQLASVLEKSEAAIRAWESGRTKPDADTLIRLSDIFHCSADFILGLSDRRETAVTSAPDNPASSAVYRVNSLSGSERAYILDIFEQVLGCLEQFKNDENARETFLTSFFSLFMDLRLCVNNIADYLGNDAGKPQPRGQALMTFATMRDITDMDYQALWSKLERLLDEDADKSAGGRRVLTAGAAM